MMAHGTTAALTDMTALVADDNPSLCRLMESLLWIMGAPAVLRAASVVQAVDVLATRSIDLVICDWHLGRSAGAIVRAARGRTVPGGGRGPAIVATSAALDPDMARAKYLCGADAVMGKPLGLTTFLQVVCRAVGRPVVQAVAP
jgi:CheY-like chemotaxis protein